MRKKIISVLGILSMVLFVSTTCNPASAATYAVGVNVGATADYNIKYSLYPNSTTLHMQVFGVVGTVVTLNMTQGLANGTKLAPYMLSGDLNGALGLLFLYLIAKNLTTNDPVYPGSTSKINSTETMSVAGADRTVCHLNLTTVASGAMGNIWWDRQTGIVVKSNFAVVFIGWVNCTLTSTSLWSGGLFGLSTTTWIIIIVVGVVVLAAIVVLARRGGKKKH